MATYVIADLHLSEAEGCNKAMDVFGRRWTGYVEKLKRNWSKLVGAEDDVIIPGDISWALTLGDAEADLRLLDSLPGHKYLLKGNHDFWWSSMTKNRDACKVWGLSSLSFLHNNALETEEYLLTGTRGWFYEEDASGIPDGVDFKKLILREAGRLRLSLEAAATFPSSKNKETLVFMHFPPIWNESVITPFIDVLCEFGIRRCYYGHIHGNYTVPSAITYRDIQFSLISADYLNFVPYCILPL